MPRWCWALLANWLAAGIAGLGALVALMITALPKRSCGGRYLVAASGWDVALHRNGHFAARQLPRQAIRDFQRPARRGGGGQWEIDWKRFDQFRKSSEKARQSGDWQAAVRDATRAISFLLQELRTRRIRRPATQPLNMSRRVSTSWPRLSSDLQLAALLAGSATAGGALLTAATPAADPSQCPIVLLDLGGDISRIWEHGRRHRSHFSHDRCTTVGITGGAVLVASTFSHGEDLAIAEDRGQLALQFFVVLRIIARAA